MSIDEIKLKIEEEQKSIDVLIQKKQKIDEKINQKKKKIDDLEKMIQTKQYADIDSQLDSLGISREELLNALMSGDMLELLAKK